MALSAPTHCLSCRVRTPPGGSYSLSALIAAASRHRLISTVGTWMYAPNTDVKDFVKGRIASAQIGVDQAVIEGKWNRIAEIIGRITQLPSPRCSLPSLVWLKQPLCAASGTPAASPPRRRITREVESPPGPHAQTGVRNRNRTPPEYVPSRWAGRWSAGPGVRGPS